jgi:YesN/AraC family two-component response regulator
LSAKYTDLMLKSYLMLFLGQLLRDHEQDALIINNSNNQKNSILGLLQYIQEHRQTVTLTEAAEWLGFNYIQTSRLIKEYTGRTFSELRREMRVHKAKELLHNPSLSMEEIVEAAGYHDVSHFYRDFKQFYGMTPMVYRAKQYKD